MKKRAQSQLAERVVNWQLFDETMRQAREAFADVPADELENTIDEAVASARREKRRERQSEQ